MLGGGGAEELEELRADLDEMVQTGGNWTSVEVGDSFSSKESGGESETSRGIVRYP